MKRVICKRIEVIHIDDIYRMYGNTIELYPGKSFMNIPLDDNALYQGLNQTGLAGVLLNETVTAKMKYLEDFYLLRFPLRYYVLRLFLEEEAFLVGSVDYPAELTYSTDKFFINLTFKSSHPA